MARKKVNPKRSSTGLDLGFEPPAAPDYAAEVNSAVAAYNALENTARVAYREPLSRATLASQALQAVARQAVQTTIAQAVGNQTQLAQVARDAVAGPLTAAFEMAAQSGAIQQAPVSQAAGVGSGTCGLPDDQYPGTDWYVTGNAVCDPLPHGAFALWEGFDTIPKGACILYGPDSHACCNHFLSIHGGYPDLTSFLQAICDGTACKQVAPPPPPPPACSSWDVVYDPALGCSVACSPAPLPVGGSYVVQGVTQVEAEAALSLMPCVPPAGNGGSGGTCPVPPEVTWDVVQKPDGTCYPWPGGTPPMSPDDKVIKDFLSYEDARLQAQQCVPTPVSEPACDYIEGVIGTFPVASWCSDSICDDIGDYITGIIGGDSGTISRMLGFGSPDDKRTLPKWLVDLMQMLPGSWGCAIADTIRDGVLGFSEMVTQISTTTDSKLAALIPALAARAVLGFIEHWTHIGLEDTATKIDYALNYVSPTEIPGQAELNEAWLRGTIPDEIWKCLTRANNNCDNWQRRILYSRYTRPEVREILDAWLRGLIDDVELDQRLREVGVVRNDDKDIFKELAFEVPNISDIIRFMVRNVYDKDIVAAFHLDDEFEQKFAGDLPSWAKAQGITDEAIRAEWRAHWQIPAPTQLYEMLRRLRPGRVDDSIVTRMSDVDRALGENDVLPFWRQRLVAISYNPLTRVDLRRMYQSGAINREELVEAYQDIGYSQQNSLELRDFADVQLLEQVAKSPEIKLYREGGANAQQAIALLANRGISQETAIKALARVRPLMAAESQAKCSNSIQKRYLIGDISDEELSTSLLRLGLDPDWVASTVQLLKCELAAKGKSISAAELCSWVEQGIISSAEFATRLLRLGYSPQDATRVVKSCSNKIATKQAAKILKAQKEKDRQEKAAARDAELLQKQRDAAAKARMTAAMRKASLAERLSRQLAKAVAKLNKVSGNDYQTDDATVQELFKRLQADKGSGPQTTADAITQAADSYKQVLPMEFGQHVSNVLDTMLAEEEEIDVNGEASP